MKYKAVQAVPNELKSRRLQLFRMSKHLNHGDVVEETLQIKIKKSNLITIKLHQSDGKNMWTNVMTKVPENSFKHG